MQGSPRGEGRHFSPGPCPLGPAEQLPPKEQCGRTKGRTKSSSVVDSLVIKVKVSSHDFVLTVWTLR